MQSQICKLQKFFGDQIALGNCSPHDVCNGNLGVDVGECGTTELRTKSNMAWSRLSLAQGQGQVVSCRQIAFCGTAKGPSGGLC